VSVLWFVNKAMPHRFPLLLLTAASFHDRLKVQRLLGIGTVDFFFFFFYCRGFTGMVSVSFLFFSHLVAFSEQPQVDLERNYALWLSSFRAADPKEQDWCSRVLSSGRQEEKQTVSLSKTFSSSSTFSNIGRCRIERAFMLTAERIMPKRFPTRIDVSDGRDCAWSPNKCITTICESCALAR
jgi:hypothetical protein